MHRAALLSLVLLVTLAGCSGSDSGGVIDNPTPVTGLRVFVAAGSTGQAAVYAGPVPATGTEWDIVHSPTTHGYTHLGDINSATATTLTFSTTQPYVLLLVSDQAAGQSSPFVCIDAFQTVGPEMYLTGRANSSATFYSSGVYDSDKLFQTAGSTYDLGAPDGKYVDLMGFMLIPIQSWAP